MSRKNVKRKAKSENMIIPTTRSDNMMTSTARSDNLMNCSAESVAAVEVIPFGGLGTTVDPKLLDQVKNLCRRCGEYRGCAGECG